MPESVDSSVSLPPTAGRDVRRNFGLGQEDPLRLAFVAGPGDAAGTFDHWRARQHDPRTPVIAYSSMFYTVVAALQAEALTLIEQDKQPLPHPGFQFVHTRRRRDRTGIRYRLDARAFAADVLRNLRAYKPDVIIVGTDAPNYLIRNLPTARRIILTAHNTYWPLGRPPDTLKARLKLRLTASALRRIDAAVCTSQACADQIMALTGLKERCLVEIPQVLPDFFPGTVSPATSARRLVYLGRVEPNKGVFDLLRAFESIAADHPSLSLDFAGSGSADPTLQAAIAASPHAGRIRFHGLLQARDVHHLLDRSDLLICPTRSDFSEGLALVVIEAAVHGVPSLVSSVVPAKTLVPGGCVEFAVDDASALAANLRQIVEAPTRYASLCQAVTSMRDLFRDRSRSWGSMLFGALML
jgi:glycogen synthase